MSLVMRLETAAAKQDEKVRLKFEYDATAADLRELLLEAARRIKQLESAFARQPSLTRVI